MPAPHPPARRSGLLPAPELLAPARRAIAAILANLMRSPHLRRRAGLAGAALLLSAGAACAHMPSPVRASTWTDAAGTQALELKVVADAGAQIHAEFTAPSGARVCAEAFERGDRQVVRYRPRESGRHRWRVLAGDGDAPVEVAQGELHAVDRGLPGQVVVHGVTLQTEDGRSFHPLAEPGPTASRPRGRGPAWPPTG